MKEHKLYLYACYSLAFIWIFTGLTSVFFASHVGLDILAGAHIDGPLAEFFVYGGGILDICLGVWLLTQRYTKLCCKLQCGVIVIYSVLLTWIDASFWLHPFGPVTKNVPIVVLILWVYDAQHQQQ
ncbi:NAD-dependent dehydratase [Pseudoalteromonas luteoviolacea]|nr:NAD-dependent dehydratase [Pseudoalteromonas luteoviolacea]AOT15047.1 NAD-dependent dehydratase [Pseudoalteromonas luteoviolacea]AOT19964.1 NAD-dependent dehydratase [Pseudoalteromonas luteoviolacea]